MLPEAVWSGPPAGVLAEADKQVDARVLAEAFANIHRRCCLGQIRARSEDLVDEELGAGQPYSQRLENLTPQVARLVDGTDKTIEFTSVDYDFSRGDRIVLSRTFDLGFDVRQLQRMQLYLRPDDTWHELWLTMEATAASATRPQAAWPLANFSWHTVTWQEPGAGRPFDQDQDLDPAEGGRSAGGTC